MTPTDELPFVSVVIPVLNGEATIDACLSALANVDYPAERREVLVVDNGSTDRTPELVRKYPFTLLREDQRRPARARNRGIEASRADIVAFTDSDCLPSTRWLRELVKPFAHDDVGAVAGDILSVSAPNAGGAIRRWHQAPVARAIPSAPDLPVRRDSKPRLSPRSVFGRVGLFDPACPPRGGESHRLLHPLLPRHGAAA